MLFDLTPQECDVFALLLQNMLNKLVAQANAPQNIPLPVPQPMPVGTSTPVPEGGPAEALS